MSRIEPVVIDVADVPDAVKACDVRRPVVNELGEITGHEVVRVEPTYTWKIITPAATYFVSQLTDIWRYSPAEDESEREYAEVIKLGLGARAGRPVYGGEEGSRAYISRATFDALAAAGVLVAAKAGGAVSGGELLP
jgi:hypothetical protein